MATPLAKDLAAEQRAFLGRNRALWADHLARARDFLGQGLGAADPAAPVLVLGAGSGLEVPWRLAPASTVGWDADPWSRVRTLLRHRRFPPWVFQDLTGGLDALAALAWRTARQPWSGRVRATGTAARRLAGLIGSLEPSPEPLRAWIREHRPGTILAANVMGQFGVVAQRIVERAFQGRLPWAEDPDLPDPLFDALQGWTARAVRAWMAALLDSGASLWLIHDRGVVFGDTPVTLGPMAADWIAQLRSGSPLEVSDPLCGVDVVSEVQGRILARHQRWLWPVAPGQTHIVEAMQIPTSSTFLSHNPD
ncbi:MAG: hypothetical protein P4L36_19810 [Holophaga sp.]|nr:hypothetical protein [Holophaga sp.]